MFFSGDDVMNMTYAWNLDPVRLFGAVPLFWTPVYRPLGSGIYRIFYAVFGFHPEPLYVFSWLLLSLNVFLGCRLFRVLSGSLWTALAALSITLVHGTFQDLYLSAGTIFDRLCFLFTALGLALYAEWRGDGRPLSRRQSVWIAVICLLALDSKESGVVLIALLGCYELVFVIPDSVRNGGAGHRLRGILPLFAGLGALALAFVFLRVNRTPELMMTPAYQAKASLTLWLTRLAEYFGMLAYRGAPVGTPAVGIPGVITILTLTAAAAGALRNRAMIFGLLFFLLAVTPVALIASRPGYVLYVPELGLGLYLASLAFELARRFRIPDSRDGLVFAAVACSALWFHAAHWPPPFDPRILPELRLAEELRRDYPSMPEHSRLLYVSDDFPPLAFDLAFTVRLFYNDKSLVVHRLAGPRDQTPEPGRPLQYDHVFALTGGSYEELDNRDVREAVRLHILRRFTVGREMDFSHRDYPAYLVSGIEDGENPEPSRWTKPKAVLKFDLYPAPAVFTAKFWVPDFVARPERSLEVLVNGAPAGVVPLNKVGMNEIRLPVEAAAVSRTGFTLVQMNVPQPYRDAAGIEYGVVLLRAGFEYR